MNSTGALCIRTCVPPPRACPSARPHAAALRRGEKGPNLFDGKRRSELHLSGRRWGECNRKLITRSSARPDLQEFPTARLTAERTAQEELERISAFRVPDFVCPYPGKRNEFADNAKVAAYRWMDEYIPVREIYRTPKELQGFYKSDVAEWAAVSFIDCSEKDMAWLMKITIMTFILDDVIDDNNSPEKSMSAFFLELNVMIMWSFPDDEQLYNTFVELLDLCEVAQRTETLNYLHSKLAEARLKPGTLYDTSSPEVHWLCKSFGDLWAELCETTPDAFLRRWARLWQTYLLENVREIVNRKNKTIPSIQGDLESRRHTAGCWFFTTLLQFSEKVYIPDEIHDSPEMERMRIPLFDALIIDNDIWSFKKEALCGDVHNVVIALAHEENCSYAEAGIRSNQMMLDKLAEMETAIAHLEKVTPPEYHRAISVYTGGNRDFFAGAHFFYEECHRYSPKVLN